MSMYVALLHEAQDLNAAALIALERGQHRAAALNLKALQAQLDAADRACDRLIYELKTGKQRQTQDT